MRNPRLKTSPKALLRHMHACELLNINDLCGFGVGGAKSPLVKTYVSSQLDGNNATIYTYTGMAIGSGPWIIIGGHYNSGGSIAITGIKVGGVAMTLISEHPTEKHSFWRIAHPGGTTADVEVTCASGASRGTIGLWNIDQAPDSWTPTGTLYLAATSGTIAINAGGVGFGIGTDGSNAADTWTAGLTSDFTGQLGGDGASGSGASTSSATTQTLTVTTDVDKAYVITLGP